VTGGDGEGPAAEVRYGLVVADRKPDAAAARVVVRDGHFWVGNRGWVAGGMSFWPRYVIGRGGDGNGPWPAPAPVDPALVGAAVGRAGGAAPLRRRLARLDRAPARRPGARRGGLGRAGEPRAGRARGWPHGPAGDK